jgi:hypothetical protein
VSDDHLLARIAGGYIAKALQTLPPAERANDGAVMDCFVNVPEIGRVQITTRRLEHTRGRSTHYFWAAESAEIAE